MGKLIILGGPSASGKTAVKKGLITAFPELFRSLITTTTRPPRIGELNGIDYDFVTLEEFNSLTMVEQTEYAGVRYGVPTKALDVVRDDRRCTIAVMDANGIVPMQEYLGRDSVVSVYLEVSKDTLIKRLIERGLSDSETGLRVKKAIDEEMTLKYKSRFDFSVVNEDVVIEETIYKISKLK